MEYKTFKFKRMNRELEEYYKKEIIIIYLLYKKKKIKMKN